MKNLIYDKSAIFMFFFSFFLIACSNEGDYTPPIGRALFFKPVDPQTDVNRFSRELNINGENISGNIASLLTSTNNPSNVIKGYIKSASITKDNTLFLPLLLNDLGFISESIYIQINGADNYWKIQINQPTAKSFTIPIGIPSHVLNGSFNVKYMLENTEGLFSELVETNASVVSPISNHNQGQFDTVEGEDGLTITTYEIPPGNGIITINYNTYTIKDRVDIRYNNQWVASTGEVLIDTQAPEIKECSNTINGDGFVGERNTVTIPYNATKVSKIDIYVSGCLNNGTRWRFSLGFSDLNSNQLLGSWYDALPDCPCELEANTLNELNANDSLGEWLECGEADQEFHFGAVREIRWRSDEFGNSGQQCTYDANNKLITGGIAAGSPDKVSPRSCGISINGALNFQNAAVHNIVDVKPWKIKPCYEYLRNWPANKGNNCTNNPISDIQHILDIVRNMTCEDITLFFKSVDEFGSLELKNYILYANPRTISTNYLNNMLNDLITLNLPKEQNDIVLEVLKNIGSE